MVRLICLMPTYNKEGTLAKAIESVMMQKTDFDYKLIILDDCSTDNSNRIANEYKTKFPDKIDIVRNEINLKLLRTMINAYKLLNGVDYFCVLDADDWYTYNKKFADAVKFLDNNLDYSLYMTNILLKKADSKELYYKGMRKTAEFSLKDRKNGKAFFIQTSGVVYRNIYFKEGENNDFDKVLNLAFPESYRADGFRFEWYLQGGKAYFKNQVESVYNYDNNGIWSSMSPNEQLLHNAKLMFGCAQFITKEQKYYLSESRKQFKRAILSLKNSETPLGSELYELIAKLTIHLTTPMDPFWCKILKMVINLIPSKKIRQKLRSELV